MQIEKPSARQMTLRLTMTAMFMAMTVACSTFSIPVPGGHLYLCDVPICLAAILMDPVSAFLVGGVGSFLGDLLFYPLPMFVSLASHGLQAVIISLCAHYTLRRRPVLASALGVVLGGIVMIVGYSLGRAFIYATPEIALIKLPYEILQAAVGAVGGLLLCWKAGVRKLFLRLESGKIR